MGIFNQPSTEMTGIAHKRDLKIPWAIVYFSIEIPITRAQPGFYMAPTAFLSVISRKVPHDVLIRDTI